MIPKVIHYCWFGNNPKNDTVEKCIKSWHKYCHDYEIIEWNENNFNIKENSFVYEAYNAHKWAFISDYVRLKVLYEYGGIYCDADLEIIKNIDDLLEYCAFSGYQNVNEIPTGIMGAKSGNEWIKYLLSYYDNKHFICEKGYDMRTNVSIITEMTKLKYKIRLNNQRQIFGDSCLILPQDYLCAKNPRDGRINITNNTYAIHHFNGSWLDKDIKRKLIVRRFLNRLLGEGFTEKLYKLKECIFKKMMK